MTLPKIPSIKQQRFLISKLNVHQILKNNYQPKTSIMLNLTYIYFKLRERFYLNT